MIAGETDFLPEELKEEIVRDYLSGMSLWRVGEKYHWVKKRTLREIVAGHIRPKNTQRTVDPDEAEVVARREAVKASWTDEVASRRWVGRYLPQAESRGASLSRLFRAMGGEG
jgi:hypothetical protein